MIQDHGGEWEAQQSTSGRSCGAATCVLDGYFPKVCEV